MFYKILLDVNRNYGFAGSGTANSDVSIYAKKLSFQSGALGVYDPIANPAYMELVLDNSAGDFNLQDSNARYYGKIRKGTLVKIQGSLDGSTWVTMSMLKIIQKLPTYANDGSHELTLKCSDILQDFLNQEFVAPLQTNVRIDQILAKLHATRAAIWPYESYYQFIDHTSIGDGRSPFDGSLRINFETAETTLPFYGDNLDRGKGVRAQQYVKDAVQAEIFGLYWFSPRDELFHFISRYHANDTAISWNITTSITQVPVYTDGRDLVNDFSLSYYPRAVGASNSILWSSDSLPFSIPAKTSKRITIRYRDPNNPNASVGAVAVTDIAKGTDLIANSASDGSGANRNSSVDITLLKGAASSEIILTNRLKVNPIYITTFQLRGTPVTTYNQEVVFGYNSDSIFGIGSDASSGNDRASASENLPAISDDDFAQSYADFKVNVYGSPIQVVERLTIILKDGDTATANHILNRKIGDVVNFQDPTNGHNLDYMIVAENHSISPNNNPPMHTVIYTLRPTIRGSLFLIGESLSNEGDILAF